MELNNLSPIETEEEWREYEREHQFQEDEKHFYNWLDEIYDNRILYYEENK